MDQPLGRKHGRSSSSEVQKSSMPPEHETEEDLQMIQQPVKKRKIEKSVIRGMDFGQRPPPIYKSIKDLLKRYPNGQIFKELIQNADDAGATVVGFYIDSRHHRSRDLPHEKLSEYQGPALIAANDAVFTEKDWKGIQQLQDSVKADDPFSVGKFGIGFNSVYHITDVPSIVSGDKIAYLDPQERIWPEKHGKMFNLSDLFDTDALFPFSGIEGFCHHTTFKYSKTLFRFPLRNKPSVISENTYSPESIIELIEVLKDEANFLLLFLQSVHTIVVKTITPKGNCRLLFQVQISPDVQQSVTEERKSFQSKLHTAHESNPHGISSCISNVLTLSIEIKNKSQQSSKTTSWLVANQVGSTNEEVLKAAAEQHTFPWVGAAIELHEDDTLSVPSDGRVFCFLPLPIEVVSTLPVHINGTFGLNDDRRAIKWPEKDRKNDQTAQWNQMLIRDCLPSCYNLLLKKAIKDGIITPKYLYNILPEIDTEAPWNSILEPFYTFLFQWKWLRTVEYNKWVDVEEATITNEGDKLPKVVCSVLIDCGTKVVEVPNKIYEALENFSSSFTIVSEEIVRDELRANLSKYNEKTFQQKLVLLRYCLRDEKYSDLDGLELIPLADESFQAFSTEVEDGEDYIYVCSKDFPRKLLPNSDSILIDLVTHCLQTDLTKLANSGYTQLTNLDEHDISALLPQCYPSEWKNKCVVRLSNENQTFPVEWFDFFWKWVQNYSLSLFKACFIIPIATKSVGQSLTVTKLRTHAKSSVVLISGNECPKLMLDILEKFKVLCTMPKYVPYLMHHELHQYVNGYNPRGVLNAISNTHTDVSDVKLDENEAFELQRFLSPLSLSKLTDSQRTILFNLQIFEMVNNEELTSLQQASETSWNGSVIIEPPEFSFSQESLPDCLVILSRNNEKVLVNACSGNDLKVSSPKFQLTFILKEIIPLIKSEECPQCNIDLLMEQVLYLIPALKRKYPDKFHDLTSKLSHLSFLRVDGSSTRKAPRDLYDYSKTELCALFQGKSVFPRQPFNKEELLQHLRECDLQTSVKGQVILLLLTEIAIQGRHVVPQKVDKQELSRAKAILSYIRKVPNILSDVVSFAEKSEQLKSAIKKFSHDNCWLPICAFPPDDYIDSLPWKGRTCTSHVASMSESILLCSNRDLDTLPHLVGSQMYIVECPQALCKVLQTSAVPSKNVFSHFKLIIQNQRDIDSADLDQLVNLVYKHLQDNLSAFQSTYATRELCTQKIVWWKSQRKFIAPNKVVFKKHPTFDSIADLSPYYIPLPGNLSQYKRLLIHFGVQEQLTDSNIISVLKMIKEDKRRTSNEQLQLKRKWKTVENILNWLTNEGTKDAHDKVTEDDTLLVPVDSEDLLLVDVEEVVYTDLDYLKSFTYDEDSSVHFIHENFAHLASHLGVRSLSSHLNISLDAFGDVGQQEPLVTRIKNILKDYQDGLTIIKELIQNADDAGATEMTICYDSRSHSVSSPKSLIFPGMAKCHGPALLVHNNATFTDKDFENITKLAGATKMDKPLKIGKFGVGFCSVYHITDIPSFISRQWLYIFDPMITYLRKEIIDKSRPGKKVSFTEKIVQSSEQLIPYQSMFGFNQAKPYQGTLFRFPFRTSASEISGIIYNKKEVDKLLNDLLNAGSRLLLFVNNLQSITFSLIGSKDDKPKVVCSFKKTVIYRVPLADSATSDNCVFQIKEGNISTEKGRRTHYTSTYWLVSNCEQQFERRSHSSKLHSASVACLLHQHHYENYLPQQISGEIFCYLPLSLETGLPVHVSANFAVLYDRSGIHSSDADRSPSDKVQWNISLMQTVVPKAYYSLLLALKQLCAAGKISMSDYKYYSMWPLASHLKIHNPWDDFVSFLYQSLSESELFYSACRSQWVQLADAHILSLNILSTTESSLSEFVVGAAKQLGYLLIDLPSNYQSCLPSANIEACLVDEEEFLNYFFENITSVSICDRNEILFLTFKAFDFRNEDYIEQHLKSNACIPLSPHGDCIKMCSDIIDPKAEFACLYDQSDNIFPLEKFYNNKHVRSSMRELGMIYSHLPIPMLEERAKTLLALFSADRNKALEKSKMILHCVTQLVKHSEQPVNLTGLVHVAFLPVMERPDRSTYPACFQWFGQKQTLLCGKELVKGSDSAALLAGSQVCILNELSIEYGGCGHIPEGIATTVGISLYPTCDSIIEHLKHIETVYIRERDKKSLKKWIEAACGKIYDHLDSQISKRLVSTDQLKELKDMNSVWTGHSFISPDLVARSWDRRGPYLYCIPHLFKNRNNLVGILKFKEEFTCEDFLNALKQACLENNGRSIFGKKEIMRAVLDILHELVYLLNKEASSLTDNQVCYIPDTSGILRKTSELAYNDAPWCQVGEGILFVHGEVSRDIATRLGVTPVRSKALELYESTKQHWDGMPFGQHESLIQRIRNILEDYPRGITVFKELLQNADDAKATKMYVILDKRMHGTEKLPSNEWQDLQGPALLVWNDSVFREEDLKSIQELGLGRKRSSSEAIGQFGIGFNVVYHLTDCPSFLTNGEVFCILDPHCRYVPGAKLLKPGRRYDGVDASFWENWSDLKSAYLREESVKECPDEVQNSGTLFRFPLRHSEELVQKSELICEEASRFGSSKRPLTVGEMKNDLDRWFPVLKEALLFLNHVTELKLFEIDHNSSMVLTHYYLTRFQQKIDYFADSREPFVDNFSVFLHECLPQENTEKWIIQLGIGDIKNPQQHWIYLPKRKPRHGLAFPINKVEFNGRIFCFLPLPSLSHLPVHVNGDFILDSARRGLWTSRDSSDTDERYKWNRHLLEAIASSYTELLVSYQGELFSPASCQSSQDVENNIMIKKYYKLFPRWLKEHKMDSEMQFLATLVYQKLSLLNSPVLIARNDDDTNGPFSAEWLPPSDAEKPSQQVHFWDDESLGKNLPPVLKRIGINLTAAPMFIRDHFEDCNIQLPLADPVTAYNYYCSYFSQVSERFPCPITGTKFQSIENFLKFINYVMKREDGESGTFSKFPDFPDGIPLLLTSDESLRCFSEDKVICSKHSMIFAAECGDKFLHPEMYKLRLTPDYFIQPGKENWDMISSILHSILPGSLRAQKVTNASEIIDIQDLLSPLWKCLVSDRVFMVHFDEIMKEWALLLTTSDELFAYKSDQQLLPVISHVIPLPYYSDDYKVLQILEEHGMPVLNTEVIDPSCCQFCPQMSEPQKMLINLKYLYEQNGLDSLMNDTCADQIATLFAYFRRIHFALEPESLRAIKSLPLFKDVRDGKYCTLSGKAYIWPNDVIMLDVGREQWIEQTSVVYLHPLGNWNKLGDDHTLQLNEISPLLIYTKFIFPHFHLLSDEKRIIHLKHIRDTECLFDTAWNNRTIKDIGGVSIYGDFIDALKHLPCLLKNGKFQPISMFCDPDVPVLGIFLEDECFPPDDLIKDSKWLQFFQKLGLRQKATKDEFITFCRRVASDNQQHIRESSWALMECLFETTRWHNNVQFLNKISEIPFVCTEHVKDLNWIAPVASAEKTMQQRGKTFHLTSLKKSASLKIKELIWTIKPIVELPYGMLSRSEDKQKVADFLWYIKVGREPSIEDVVKNMKQISESRFASFKLFDHSTEDCTPSIERKELLFKVLVRCYEYLKDIDCSTEDLNCLLYAPCIPVTTTDHDFSSDSAVPVTALITPLQVVASTDTTIKQLVPFLNPLPEDLYPVLSGVLSKIGVTTEIQYKHLRNALEAMYQYIEQPLDPNSVKIVKHIIKKFHTIEVPQAIGKPVYLPSELKMLVESTNLLHDDHGRYKNAHLDTKDLSYSFISLLVDRNEERSEYGFSLKDFVSSLPQAIRPLLLSVHCYEKLSSGCSIQEHPPHSDFIHELEIAFGFPDFAKVVETVLLVSSVEEETCRKFTQKLAAFCSSVQLSVVPNLKVDVYLTLCHPPILIGTAKVDFAFLQNTDSDSFVICVDPGTKMKPKVLESFSKRLISTIAVLSNTSVEDLGEIVEGNITDLLQDQSQDAIAELLGELGVRSENPTSSDYRPVSVKLGNRIPDYLHHRLYADIHNIFRPQELFGYENMDNNYIFARVNYRIAEPAEEGELEKYCVSISEDDEEGMEVTIIEMYKILRMKEVCKDSGNREMVLYDPESDGVQIWEAIKDETLKEILKKVAHELKKIWNIRDKDLRRKAIKALYLKWHPHKNPHRFATKVFQFIQQQVERLERGLDVDVDQFEGGTSGFTSDFWKCMGEQWEEEVRTQGENWRREKDRRRGPSMTTQDNQNIDLDEILSENSVSADPRMAQVWLKQAEHDLTALKVLVKKTNIKKEICAHVCFMAHQVAEKGLKAGMYKLIGLHPSVLRWHQLIGHASALEQVKPRITNGLREMVRSLESYYLDPRYPNRYNPIKVPSDQYTEDEAMQAERTAQNVMNIIKKLF